MAKANPLTKGLAAKKGKDKQKASQPAEAPANGNGLKTRVLIGGHFSPELQFALKMICINERRTLQSLMAEAFNQILVSRGQPAIADTGKNESAA